MRQVKRRTRCLGPGLNPDELEVDRDLEPESDELSSSRRIGAVGATSLSPTGIFAIVPGLTSPAGAGGLGQFPQRPSRYALHRGSFRPSWKGTLSPYPGNFTRP